MGALEAEENQRTAATLTVRQPLGQTAFLQTGLAAPNCIVAKAAVAQAENHRLKAPVCTPVSNVAHLEPPTSAP